MKNKFPHFFSAVFIAGIIYWSFYVLMPQKIEEAPSFKEFSTKRALVHVKKISQKPHYIGSKNHEVVAEYIITELKKMGLSPEIQEGFVLTDWGNLTKPKNIIARIKGTSKGKALLLLSHYDSAPHSSSRGASDDASGVATVLEGVRAFLQAKTAHKNDIIIVFSDAEELGLNGAALFVTKHSWTKEVGLAINFEARGSSGPGFMLMEVNQGNAAMVKGFANANPAFAVSNSLMYSIYKMLPNDTDLTVFRKQGKIQGFNFAFIDNHFNYHTAQDNYQNLNQNTLAHQGSYLMPMLQYFSNSDLSHLNSTEDEVYFNTPFGFVSYPFSWVFPMWIAALVLFLIIVFIGIGKRSIEIKAIGKGFVVLFIALISVGLTAFLGWKILLKTYPNYEDIQQGFTYNGHDYIFAFVLLSLSICFMVYGKFSTEKTVIGHFVAPIFLWILVNLAISLWLPGAGFLLIPVFSSLLLLLFSIMFERTSWIVQVILALPVLILLVPFIKLLPIGLGLQVLFVSGLLCVIAFGLLLSVFGNFTYKYIWALFLFLASVGFFVDAHFQSEYKARKAKPNSLIYVLNKDTNRAYWLTYDINLDSWTKRYLTEQPAKAIGWEHYPLFSKHNSAFTFSQKADVKKINGPTIQFLKDSMGGNRRFIKIKISPNRAVNRYDVFADESMSIAHFKANNVSCIGQKEAVYERTNRKILSYYVVENLPLELEFDMNAAVVFNMDLLESSFDLLTNPAFKMRPRASWMMPMPFVLNDAVSILQKIDPLKK